MTALPQPPVNWPGLGTWIARRAAISGQDLALVHGDQRWTYAEFDARIRRAAAHLRRLGVVIGERVAFHGRNEPAALESLFAAAALGAVWVPIHPARPAGEVRFIVDDADARVIVRGDLPVAPPELGARTVVTARDLVGPTDGADPDLPVVPTAPDDLVVLGYTSGTSGAPKGVMLTHANLSWNVAHMIDACAISGADIALAAAPLTRVGGLAVTVLETLFVGGAVIIPAASDGEGVLRTVERERVSLLFANPDLLDAMATAPSWPTADLTCVRAGIVGGGLVPDALLQAYLARGVRLRHGYGLTEASPVVTLLDDGDAVSHVRSVGRPVGVVEIGTRRDDGSRCEAGEIGEVVVRGPNVTSGYWRRPDATDASRLEDGWFRTGDAGAIDADGYLMLEGRVTDAIRVPEGLVYPSEIERLIYRAPGIVDFAVIGVDGRVTLVVVPEGGAAVTLDDARRLLGPSLPAWKLPTVLRMVSAIPRNAAGKVLREPLAAAARAGA